MNDNNETQFREACSCCGRTDIPMMHSPTIKLCINCLNNFNIAALNALGVRIHMDRQKAEKEKKAAQETGKADAPDMEPEPDPVLGYPYYMGDDGELMTPSEIVRALDEYVIGQDEAKKSLAVAVYNHYKRLINNLEEDSDVEIQKSNILMVGPTGSGKTYLAKTLAGILDVPFAIADATSITEAGYVGDDVESMLHKLLMNADGDVEEAERGIIYIDEIDKISRLSENPSITRDVSGEGVQQALLKIIEGTVARVPVAGGRKTPNGQMIEIDTSNILFICGGAFDGIEKVLERSTTHGIGFMSEDVVKKEKHELQATDIIKYGMVPELVGRLPVITQLDKKAMVDILTKPKNALVKQYERLLSMDDVSLEITDDALDYIAQTAVDKGIGARGLQSIIEKTMKDAMFQAPDMEDGGTVTISVGKEGLELKCA